MQVKIMKLITIYSFNHLDYFNFFILFNFWRNSDPLKKKKILAQKMTEFGHEFPSPTSVFDTFPNK